MCRKNKKKVNHLSNDTAKSIYRSCLCVIELCRHLSEKNYDNVLLIMVMYNEDIFLKQTSLYYEKFGDCLKSIGRGLKFHQTVCK